MKNLKIAKYSNTQITYSTKGLMLYLKGRLKFLISFTWNKQNTGWEADSSKENYRVGYRKLVQPRTTVKSFALGKLKFNLVTPTIHMGGK
jgi:hypothetical protein